MQQRNSPQHFSRDRGGIEGKLLIIVLIVMAASIGLMAWFSEPPETAATTEIEADERAATGVMRDRSGVE